MKNEMMIQAWEQIMPDSAADTRMRANILAYQRTFRKTHRMALKKYVSLAACLVLIAAACLGVRYFEAMHYSVTLESGESLVYTKSDTPFTADSMIAPYPVKSRDLTQDEIGSLFPEIDRTEDDYMFAFFKEETGEAVHLEGRIGGIRLNVSRSGLPVTDTMSGGDEGISALCGVPVKTGYAYIRQNDTAVFDAEFSLGDYTFYAENAGKGKDKYSIGKELSEYVYRMIQTGSPDFSQLHYE